MCHKKRGDIHKLAKAGQKASRLPAPDLERWSNMTAACSLTLERLWGRRQLWSESLSEP